MGLLRAVVVDLVRFHEAWMELLYPRQRGAADSVLGKWTPNTTLGWIGYRFWGAIGALVVGLCYPLVIAGFFLRFQTRAADGTATKLGVLGIVVLSVLAWGALSVVARVRFSIAGFVAVVAAAVVATVSGALAVVASSYGGRASTVLVAYPLGVTAIFLPPVVAALYSPTVAEVVLPTSTSIAAWILDNLLALGGLGEYLRRTYDLRGIAYVGMWLGVAIPVGWFLGGVVSLADVVKPTAE